MKAMLRLFNAVQVDELVTDDQSAAIFNRTIRHGYVLEPGIAADEELLETIESTIGLSGAEANAAFYKSWKTIQESSIESLVIQQLTHYLTTYGFEQMGVFNGDAVYIPREKLEIPELKNDLPLVVIKAMNRAEILDAIIELGSGIALAEETLADIMSIIDANRYDQEFISRIQNRELKALILDLYGIVPSEPVEFLRHLISKLTDESLLIKNDALIEKIKQSNGKFLDELLKGAPDDLAAIFYRFKPLFLAMKTISRNKRFFNQLRKSAPRLHRPAPVDYMNRVTTQIKKQDLEIATLKRRLENATVFRKIRLANALNFRLHSGGSVVFRVRNGRGWATDFNWPADRMQLTEDALQVVLDSIAETIRPSVQGKTICIPTNVHYTLPATEKQFTGNFPNGSYISVPEDLVVGIHWKNTDKRVDLDLSVIGRSGKTGWDGAYRSDDNGVLFSGDMTDAQLPDGATELFYIKHHIGEAKVLMVNYYNFENEDEVRTRLIAAHETARNFGVNYMVDPNNIIASAEINISKRQNVVGLIAKVDDENRVYFSNVSIGSSISSRNNDRTRHAREYLFDSLVHSIKLRDVLSRAGAEVVDQVHDEEGLIDLSPAQIDKLSILRLLK